MGAPPSSPRRRTMRSLVGINQRWRHRRSGHVFRVVQIHRADKLVEALDETTLSVIPVSFTELRKRYELLLDPGSYR